MAVPSPASPRRIDAVTSAYVQQDKPAAARASSGPAQPRAAGNERPEQSGRAAPWSGSRGAQLPADIDAVVLEFEGAVQRVARLVLRASALLDRAAETIGAAPVCGEEREERVRHLEWAIDAGQKALQAAAGVPSARHRDVTGQQQARGAQPPRPGDVDESKPADARRTQARWPGWVSGR